jgi:hypothetical protein
MNKTSSIPDFLSPIINLGQVEVIWSSRNNRRLLWDYLTLFQAPLTDRVERPLVFTDADKRPLVTEPFAKPFR